MSRAIIIAPLARDLTQPAVVGGPVPRDVVRIAANANYGLWDTLDAEFFTALNDAAITIYATFASIPPALKKHLVRVLSYTDVTATTQQGWKILADCTVTDFIKVTNASVPATKAATTMIAGDRPVEWVERHHWAGKPMDTLAAP